MTDDPDDGWEPAPLPVYEDAYCQRATMIIEIARQIDITNSTEALALLQSAGIAMLALIEPPKADVLALTAIPGGQPPRSRL